jgi:putative N6-adenine-specific DNA methylase
MQEFTALAFCAAGAEKVLSNELKKLSGTGGISLVESGFGRVRFTAELAGLYHALFRLRTADRVLLEAASFPAPGFDALFEGTRRVRWDSYIPKGMGIHVGKVRTNRSALRAETSVQAAVHKAAAEQLCSRYGINRLPESWAAKQAELRVYLEKDRACLLVDLSGEPLFRRGYRREGGAAPLRETTAAAMILLSGWKRKFPLYDPMCGSGTIVIEAALYAWNMAPGIARNFALNDLAIADRHVCEAVRNECATMAESDRKVRVYGSDAGENTAAQAGANATHALHSTGRAPVFRSLPLSQARPPVETAGEAGFIITNPPYGRRLGSPESAEAGYREMAVLAENFPGWKLALLCDHPGFESHFGKKASSVRGLKNGAVETWLYEYDKL